MAKYMPQYLDLLMVLLSFIVSGNTVRVEVFKAPNFKGSSYEAYSYGNCHNLPEWIYSDNGSVMTSGCIMMYRRQNCNQNLFYGCKKLVRSDECQLADLNSDCAFTHFSNKHLLRSFRACTETEERQPQEEINIPCITLNAVVYGLKPWKKVSDLVDTVELNSNTQNRGYFYNNGSTPMIKTLDYTEEVTEILQFEFSESLSQISSVSFDASLEVQSVARLPFVGDLSSKLKAGVVTSSQSGSSSTSTKQFRIENRKAIKVQTMVNVPPHSITEINSSVEVHENVQLIYLLAAKITGKGRNNEALTQDEIKMHLKKDVKVYLTCPIKFRTVCQNPNALVVKTRAQFKIKEIRVKTILHSRPMRKHY